MLKSTKVKEWHGIKVYELEDGRIAIGSGQTLGALSGREKDGFLPTMARLSGQSSHLAPLSDLATFTVLAPDGQGIAKCITTEHFTALIELLVLAYTDGDLEAKDVAMGEKALHFMLLYARLGLEWHLARTLGKDPEPTLQGLVRALPEAWTRRFDSENTKAICEVYGWSTDRECGPQQIRSLRASVYQRLFGKDAFKALQARAKDSGKRMHQFLTPEAERFFERNQAVISHIAKRNKGNPTEFRAELHAFLEEQNAEYVRPMIARESGTYQLMLPAVQSA
jgi:hypothetical protein